ncbi:C40 family peptidase [Streptomyces sp. TLI_171]|uniref:C40 family peptidase n=1 Tax=Streptomyces sp. TLI_171 TaxID=1938859 RepID=UPI000C1A48B6|nr:C40 family peptidase [Streptomyces sp. TLI_171]RKE20134.1 cell wall-associated NlpC family hydrolase [Streptomyces sp. TLI_171]
MTTALASISTDPADLPDWSDAPLLGFAESDGASACRCLQCTRPAPRTGGSGAAERAGRIHRAVRSTCLAATVLAGAGIVGLGLGATSAHAMPAPSGPGWDGKVYWFKNAAGEWRYTKWYNVYLDRTGGAKAAQPQQPAQQSQSSGGLRQGWDGKVYWFRNAAGEWRYTSHYDVYVSRTGDGGQAPQSAQQQSSAPAADGVEAAVSYALAQVGKPYVWGGNGPDGFDCSGLVQQAFRRAGIAAPRVADDQYRAATPIGSNQLRRGDLVFWSSNGRVSGIHHVAVYLGDGTYVEAPRPGKDVRVSRLSSGYYPDFFGRLA